MPFFVANKVGKVCDPLIATLAIAGARLCIVTYYDQIDVSGAEHP